MFYGPCGRPGLLSGLICLSAHKPICQAQLKIQMVPVRVHGLQIGHDQSFPSVSSGLWRKKIILAARCFWYTRHGSVALCLSGQCVQTSEQIVKMAASFKFCLISNLHGTVKMTDDSSFIREGDGLLSNRWNPSLQVLINFFRRGQTVWLIQYVPQRAEDRSKSFSTF